KELSTFSSHSLGLGVSYTFVSPLKLVEKGSLNFSYHHLLFNYDDFRDLRDSSAPTGHEPLYQFSANVFQFYLSLWY
ncbi:MAG: hypothetical protein FD130_2616, partial [Halothiobacillaceae bacterium]